ncbi:MAG: glycosyltransferase family 4 protein [Flavobacteriales bacterium]|nr:glycosyltransferase family 4 protein [Flavobacteriales bacterium]
MQREPRVLVLYTEIAPYVLACLDALVARTGACIELVRWPTNAEAPFDFGAHPGITLHDRSTFTDAALLEFAQRVDPDLVIASGWVDKGYLRVCRAMRGKGIPTSMNLDTAWRGDARQWLSTLLARFWMPRTYSHIWATGSRQVAYARRLGSDVGHILTGLYAADVMPFISAFREARRSRAERYPHRFIHVARYIPTKGQQLLCDAFAELCDQGRAGDWELHLVGTGEQYDQVRNSPSGRHPRIVHRGFVQANDVPQVLAEAGVSVLPSLYEPWGVVVQEHACMGLPLLLSDAVGAGERFLQVPANGDLHKAGDKADLQRSLLKVIGTSDADLLRMGDRSAELGASWTPELWAAMAEQHLLKR